MVQKKLIVCGNDENGWATFRPYIAEMNKVEDSYDAPISAACHVASNDGVSDTHVVFDENDELFHRFYFGDVIEWSTAPKFKVSEYV